MTEELKSAIRVIAEYDKGWTNVNSPIHDVWEYTDEEGVTRICRYSYIPYHVSADALLPVWRKVGDDMNNQVTITGHYKVREAGSMILNNKLPEACLKLAEIINQLKEQK